MIYWLSRSITSSLRLYYETKKTGRWNVGPRVNLPVGVASFPAEPFRLPRKLVEPYYNIKRWTKMPSGGHFAALEEPELLVKDIQAFFRSLSDKNLRK